MAARRDLSSLHAPPRAVLPRHLELCPCARSLEGQLAADASTSTPAPRPQLTFTAAPGGEQEKRAPGGAQGKNRYGAPSRRTGCRLAVMVARRRLRVSWPEGFLHSVLSAAVVCQLGCAPKLASMASTSVRRPTRYAELGGPLWVGAEAWREGGGQIDYLKGVLEGPKRTVDPSD